MAKLSHGATRGSAGKKKSKKRPESRQIAEIPATAPSGQPAYRRETPNGDSGAAVLQFRPRAREAAAPRIAARASGPARGFQQVIDYGYVYTDLKIIGGLSLLLFGGLVALSFVIR